MTIADTAIYYLSRSIISKLVCTIEKEGAAHVELLFSCKRVFASPVYTLDAVGKLNNIFWAQHKIFHFYFAIEKTH